MLYNNKNGMCSLSTRISTQKAESLSVLSSRVLGNLTVLNDNGEGCSPPLDSSSSAHAILVFFFFLGFFALVAIAGVAVQRLPHSVGEGMVVLFLGACLDPRVLNDIHYRGSLDRVLCQHPAQQIKFQVRELGASRECKLLVGVCLVVYSVREGKTKGNVLPFELGGCDCLEHPSRRLALER